MVQCMILLTIQIIIAPPPPNKTKEIASKLSAS